MKEYIREEILKCENINLFKLNRALLFNLNLRFVFLLRLSQWFIKKKIPFFSGYLNRKLVIKYGCFIGLHSKIGIGVQFPHPNGIVIGADTVIGKNCIIYQQVTFGGKVVGDAQKGNYPKIGNNVTVFAGSKLIGDIRIGDNVVIGANSVVNKDIPSFSIAAGIPAKIIKRIEI